MKTRFALWTMFLLAIATVSVPAVTLYVDLNSTNPVPPYADWSTAATNIQDAIDASTNGDLILVTNRNYRTSGRIAPDGWLTSVVVTNAVTLHSVNGLSSTLIDEDGSMRCMYLTNDVASTGFTLTNGYMNGNGDGICCTSTNTQVSNCLLINNYSGFFGGAAYLATLNNCKLANNYSSGYGGGAALKLRQFFSHHFRKRLNRFLAEFKVTAGGGE